MAFPRFLPLLLVLVLMSLPSLAYAEDVTIYRCVSPGGALALRDSPCLKGETQQVRSMVRPKDPAPGTAPVTTPATPPPVAPVREVQVVYRTPPRPMYECVTADGDRYTSDNGEGNPRSVPLWTLGYPMWSHRNGGHGPGATHDSSGNSGSGRPPRPGMILPAGTAWVRDECHALPQEEVCDRLSDRRYEIIRRYNSAMQGERRQLELEQRGIDARLSNDCGNP
jgi:hypothetical protein